MQRMKPDQPDFSCIKGFSFHISSLRDKSSSPFQKSSIGFIDYLSKTLSQTTCYFYPSLITYNRRLFSQLLHKLEQYLQFPVVILT